MNFIQGQCREQMVLIPDCLDSLIDAENEIRIIDLFVDSLNMADFNFTIKQTLEGRPAYHPKDLLKLFIYGYLNSIRSSRKLEAECRQMIIRDNITEVAYNIQSTTDAKHNIPIDYKVTANNDSKAMGNMLRRASADVGFMFVAYNFKRILNIIGFEKLRLWLREIIGVNLMYLHPVGAYYRFVNAVWTSVNHFLIFTPKYRFFLPIPLAA